MNHKYLTEADREALGLMPAQVRMLEAIMQREARYGLDEMLRAMEKGDIGEAQAWRGALSLVEHICEQLHLGEQRVVRVHLGHTVRQVDRADRTARPEPPDY